MREAITQSIQNLRANKLRSFLTMFGILWGMISVVVLSATGEGFRRGNDKVLRELGKNIAIVWGGRTSMQAGGERAGRQILLTLDDALSRLLGAVSPLSEIQTLSTFDALGRVLRQDVRSALDVPPQDNTSMDGYALRATDRVQSGLRVIGRALAGHPFAGTLGPGEAVRITTGAALAAGADAVAMQEDVHLEHDHISISPDITTGLNVRPRGGLVLGGGVSSGRLLIDQCDIVAAFPATPRRCRRSADGNRRVLCPGNRP